MTIQDLMTEVKLVKQQVKEIKEDNSIDIDEQNIAEMVNLRDFPKLLTDFLVTDIDDSTNNKIDINHNRLNFLSLIDKVIFQKWYT